MGWAGGRVCARSDLPLCVVDGIPKTWCVHNGKPQLHALLLYVHGMLSDLHRLHDTLWRRGKLRPGRGQGPAQLGDHTAHPNQLCCPGCRTLPAPSPPPGAARGPVCSLGTSEEHISQHRKCRWLLAPAPASSLLRPLFSNSWNPLGGQRGFWPLPCFSTQVFREQAGGLPGWTALRRDMAGSLGSHSFLYPPDPK